MRETNSSRQRLFLALWPDTQVSTNLYEFGNRAVEAGIGGRLLPAENLHLTLVFFGEVDLNTRACIEQAVSSVRTPGFCLILDRIGYWRRSGILWAEATSIPEPLQMLVRILNENLACCGYTQESRAYRAHVTLARHVRKCKRQFTMDPVVWRVDRFSLVESQLHPNGARYQIIKSWGLNYQNIHHQA